MRQMLAFFLGLFGFCDCIIAQQADTLTHWGASVGMQKGQVLIVDDYQRKWQKGRDNFSVDAVLSHVTLPADSDAFARDYGYPTIGMGLKMAFNHGVTMHKSASPEWGMAEEVDYDSRMGNSIVAYASFSRPLLRKKKWEIDYTFSTGIGYSKSVYDPHRAVDNELIGSHGLIFFGAGTHIMYRFSPEWGIRVGADFWHLSNGALSRPNKGANILGPSAALVYCPYYDDLVVSNPVKTKAQFSPFLFLNFSLGIGAKSLNEEWLDTQFNTPKEHPDYRKADFDIYMAYSLQADVMYRYARRWASGIGADVFYGTYSSKVEQIDAKYQYQVMHSPWSVGLALKHQVYYHRLALAMSLGYYLFRRMGYNANLIEKPYYERIGLQYTLPVMGGITLGFDVKAHLTKADLMEIVVAKPIVFK